jgi:hypothetical protein
MSDETRDTEHALHGIVSREHRQLDDLFGELEASFANRGDPDAVRDAFAALSEQLEVHFEQEDRLYFASIGALCPELAPQVRAIADAHRGFRRELAAIRQALDLCELALARGRIAELADGFRRHEAREEALLQRVDAGARI